MKNKNNYLIISILFLLLFCSTPFIAFYLLVNTPYEMGIDECEDNRGFKIIGSQCEVKIPEEPDGTVFYLLLIMMGLTAYFAMFFFNKGLKEEYVE